MTVAHRIDILGLTNYLSSRGRRLLDAEIEMEAGLCKGRGGGMLESAFFFSLVSCRENIFLDDHRYGMGN